MTALIEEIRDGVLAIKRAQVEAVLFQDPAFSAPLTTCLVEASKEYPPMDDGSRCVPDEAMPVVFKRAISLYLEQLPAPVAAIISEALASPRL